MTDHQHGDDPCDSCAVWDLWHAANHGTGTLAVDPHLRHLVREVVRVWNDRCERDRQAAAARAALAIGCPYCGQPADALCITAGGKAYEERYGIVYVHAARRRALADLMTPDAQVIAFPAASDV